MPVIGWNSASVVNTTLQTRSGDNARGLTVLTDGSYVITWTGYGSNGTDGDVYVRRYDSLGNAISPAILVHADNADRDTTSSAIALPNGGYAIIWLQNSNTVLAQKFTSNNNIDGTVISVASDSSLTYAYNVSSTAQSDGTIAVAYT